MSELTYQKAKEIFTGIVAFISIATAVEGLNTWKNQLRGEYEFNLASSILKQVNEIKTAFLNISRMWMYFIPAKEDGSPGSNIKIFVTNEYFKNINYFSTKINELETSIIEIDISWPDFPKESINSIIQQSRKYLRVVNILLIGTKPNDFISCDIEKEDVNATYFNNSRYDENGSMYESFNKLQEKSEFPKIKDFIETNIKISVNYLKNLIDK